MIHIPDLNNSTPVTDDTEFVGRDPVPTQQYPQGEDRRYSGKQLRQFIETGPPREYAASQIGNDSSVPGDNVRDALDALDASKLNRDEYNQLWLGLFASLAELQAAHPTASAGSYATVDPGADDPPRKYLWDVDTSEWVAGSDAAPGSTDDLPEGSQNLYFTAGRAAAAAPVQSVHGRTGDVVGAAGDYDSGQVDNASSVAGDSVSDALETLDAEKLNASDYNDRWKGLFPTPEALRAAWPVAEAGDYATVDPGVGTPARKWLWDADIDDWVAGSDTAPGSTDDLPEGSDNLYFTSQRVANAGAGNDAANPTFPSVVDTIIVRLSKALMNGPIGLSNFTTLIPRARGLYRTPTAFGGGGALTLTDDQITDGQSFYMFRRIGTDPVTLNNQNQQRINGQIVGAFSYSLLEGEFLEIRFLGIPSSRSWSITSNLPASYFNVTPPRPGDSAAITITQADSTRTVYAEQEAAITPQADLPNGFQCAILRLTDDEVTLNPPAGAVLDGRDGPGIYRIIDRATYAALEKIADDLWIVSGNVELVL